MSTAATHKSVFKKHAKTFSFAAMFLGKNADSIYTLYRFCRFIDDVADESDDPAAAREALESIKRDIEHERSDEPLLREIIALITQQNIHKGYILDLLDGVLSDCRARVVIETETDLIHYCYQVAGAVGGAMCPLLGVKHAHMAAATKPAIALGIAMQLTNIARDIQEDATHHRCYIPQEWQLLAPIEQLAEAPKSPKHDARPSCERLLALAEHYYDAAKLGYAYLPLRSKLAILVAGGLYRAIGIKLKQRGYRYWEGRVYVSKTEKFIRLLGMLPLLLRPKYWLHRFTESFPLSLHMPYDRTNA